MNNNNIQTYFEWDVISWSRVMKIWDKHLNSKKDGLALEIGGRRGGISLMLAKEYDMNVVCSDLKLPKESAQILHSKHEAKNKIEYKAVDCTEISYPDNTFDVVVFKSVLGALGLFENQQLAFNEMFRVLKPGGVLLFAENLEASRLHIYLRKKFNKWSTYWRYFNLDDLPIFLNNFSHSELNTTGFFATFFRFSLLRVFFSYFDLAFEKLLPKKSRYIVFGAAIK